MTGRKIHKHRTPISEDEARRTIASVGGGASLPEPGKITDVVSGSVDGVYIENVNGQFYRVQWNVA